MYCTSVNNLDFYATISNGRVTMYYNIYNQFPISRIMCLAFHLVSREAFPLPPWFFPRQHYVSPPLVHHIHFSSSLANGLYNMNLFGVHVQAYL